MSAICQPAISFKNRQLRPCWANMLARVDKIRARISQRRLLLVKSQSQGPILKTLLHPSIDGLSRSATLKICMGRPINCQDSQTAKWRQWMTSSRSLSRLRPISLRIVLTHSESTTTWWTSLGGKTARGATYKCSRAKRTLSLAYSSLPAHSKSSLWTPSLPREDWTRPRTPPLTMVLTSLWSSPQSKTWDCLTRSQMRVRATEPVAGVPLARKAQYRSAQMSLSWHSWVPPVPSRSLLLTGCRWSTRTLEASSCT